MSAFLVDPFARWDTSHLEFFIAVLMPYAIFGVLWQSFKYKNTKFFAATASICAVVNVLLSAPCGCTDSQYLVDKAVQDIACGAFAVILGRALLAWLLSFKVTEYEKGSNRPEITVDGWVVGSVKRFESLFRKSPPRRSNFWPLLRADLSSLGGAAFLLTGAAAVLAGSFLHLIPVIGVGLVAIGFHCRIMKSVLREERFCDVRIGVMDKLEEVSLPWRGWFKAIAVCADGTRVSIAGKLCVVQPLLDRNGSVTVAFLFHPPESVTSMSDFIEISI